jgi:phospholipid/cholesterol/gamma-HCH transport system substrate-binding protein
VASAPRLAGVGVFLLGGLLLFGVGLFMIGDRQMAFAKKFTMYTEFGRITGLQPGAIIRVAGAKAGAVTAILPPARPSARFKVRLEIIEELHPLVRTDSVASIETEGLVGGSYLEISTGSEQAPPAPAGATIAGREPFAIADLLQQMRDTISRVNLTIDSLQDDLESTMSYIAQTAGSANALITAVSRDVRTMTAAGAQISGDAAQISDALRRGQGTLGKLLSDDTLYRHAASVAAQADEIASTARQMIEQARQTLREFQSKDGSVQGLAANLKQTLDDARTAMTGFADNMEALKHNILFRGFFNERGYFNLASLSPAQYRAGLMTRNPRRTVARVWLSTAVLFEPDPGVSASERLTDGGRARLDSAIAPFLERLVSGLLIIEGYASQGSRDEQYVRSQARAAMVREYLIRKFQLDPTSTGLMPLGSDAAGSPANGQWDGVALAAFLEKGATTKR